MTDYSRKPLASPAKEKEDDEMALVKQFIQGDPNAFRAIIENNHHDVATLANRILGWPGEVDDICQEVFLGAFLGMKRFKGNSSLKTWLFKITINKCRTHQHRRMRRLRIFNKVFIPSDDHSHSVNKATTEDKNSLRIRWAVRSLPARYREPIVLRYFNEMSIDQTSSLLGVKKSTLNVRLNRARNMLKNELKDLIDK
jgi:RNA polymerase sigma-70 factor (ECF subfamily)